MQVLHRHLPARAVLLWVCCGYVVLLSYGYHVEGSIPRHRLETAVFVLVMLAICCSAPIVAALRRTPAAPASPMMDTVSALRYLPAIAVVATSASLFLYWPVLFTGFLSDDYVHMATVARGSLELGSGSFFRPASFLLWRNMTGLGAEDVALHVVNLALHAANAVLTYIVAVRLGLSVWCGIAASAVFLTFPTSVEAVSWISALPDVLATTWCLLLLCLLPDTQHRGVALLAAVVFMAALCTKETAVAIPLIAVASYGTPRRLPERSRWLLGASALLALAFTAWRILNVTPDLDFLQGPSRYLLKNMVSNATAALVLPWKQDWLDANVIGVFMWSAALAILFTRGFVRAAQDSGVATNLARLSAWIMLAIAPVYTMFFGLCLPG